MSMSATGEARVSRLKAANAAAQPTTPDLLEAAPWWDSALRLAAVAAQLALIAVVLSLWQVDSRAFRYQFALLSAGFVVHHLLPLRLRLPFFASLSIVALFLLAGKVIAPLVLVFGLLMIGVAHAPLKFFARVTGLVALGVIFGVLRATGIVPQLSGIWPILAAMFMFRLMIYMHDLRTGSAPFGFWRALAYFFMVPNALFPLFPIVDYKTFNRTHYNQDPFDIYQKGVDWIVRGILQLILYRFVYQNLVIEPHAVADAGDLARYLVANFMLYLRVSGNFHLIVGILHLFGFNLSETHHKYMLSNSFTDFWRRINIYWKDFIQKLFFFPLFFRLKKHGETLAMVVATGLAFLATWALHSYQWFWLRGHFLVTWQDITFWTILALGVMVNVVWELKNSQRRGALKVKRTWQSDLGRAVRTVLMFTFIIVLWSLWHTASWEEWTTMLAKARYITPVNAAWIIGGILLLGFCAITMGLSVPERSDGVVNHSRRSSNLLFYRSVLATAAIAGAVALVGRYPTLFDDFPQVADVLDRLTVPRLNAQDIAKLERGYYEDLTDESRFDTELGAMYAARPQNWGTSLLERDRTDKQFPNWEFIPGERRIFDGQVQTTNRWGMRDRDYELSKPAGAYRIALLGDSNSARHKVGDEQGWDHQLEEQLNRAPDASRPTTEILNFSLGSYGPYCRLRTLENRVLQFQPDAILNVSVNDWDWVAQDVAKLYNRGLDVPDAFIGEVAAKAGVVPGMGVRVAEHRLKPYAAELVGWTYRRMVEVCRQHEIRPLCAYLPRLDDRQWEQDQLPALIKAAREAGFEVVDVSDAYRHEADWDALWLKPFDAHPGVHAHTLIAASFLEKLRPLIPAPTPQPAAQ